MVSINQIERGVGRWVDAELIAKLPTGSNYDNVKRIAVAAGAVYVIRKGKNLLASIQGNTFLKTIGAVDSNGNIDLEGIKTVLTEKIPEGGIKVTVPILDEVTFFRSDVDSIYSYIMGG